MPAPLQLSGSRFGHLLVIGRSHQDRFRAWAWLCRCDCGAYVSVRGPTLKAGRTSACSSCANRESSTTHGKSATDLYRRWQAMKARCRQPSNKNYHNYGGRGISVCARWSKFENFAADMGPTFEPELELDRIDVNGNYEPANCRWVDQITQQRNSRGNRILTFRGRSMTVVEWAEEAGVKANTIQTRLRRKWPVERALIELANRENGNG